MEPPSTTAAQSSSSCSAHGLEFQGDGARLNQPLGNYRTVAIVDQPEASSARIAWTGVLGDQVHIRSRLSEVHSSVAPSLTSPLPVSRARVAFDSLTLSNNQQTSPAHFLAS